MLGNEVTVNVSNGELQMGQYQEVMLVELDGPRQRRVSAVAFGLKPGINF